MSRTPRLRSFMLRALIARVAAAVPAAAVYITAVLVVAGVVLTAAPLGVPAKAFAEEADTAEALDAETPTLVVSPPSPVLTEQLPSYTFSVLLRNPSEQQLPGGVLTLSLQLNLADPAFAELSSSEVSEVPLADELPLSIRRLSATEAEGEQVIELAVISQKMPAIEGIYTLTAEFVADPQPAGAASTAGAAIGDEAATDLEAVTVTASTLVTWGSMEAPSRMPLTLVVPLVLPSNIQGVPSRADLVTATPALTRVLDLAERENATLAVDPRIVAAVRALGSNAPAESQELVARLERTLSPLFMLQFADADPAVQAALGFTELLEPVGLDYMTRFGSFSAPDEGAAAEGEDLLNTSPEFSPGAAPDAAPGGETAADVDTGEAAGEPSAPSNSAPTTEPTPEPTTPPSADGAPTLAQLTSLDNGRAGAWPAASQVDSATLSLLTQSGIDSLVLSSANVSNATGTRVTLGAFNTLIADDDLASFAAAALGASTAIERSAGLSNLAATLALSAHQESTGAVLALDRGTIADLLATADGAARVEALLDTLGGYTWAQIVGERLQPEGVATLRAGASAEQRRELLRTTMRRSDQIDELAALLVQPEFLTQYQRVRLLEAFATRYANPEVDFLEVDQGIRSRDDELLAGVQPLTNGSTQLVGTSSRVPITLKNSLPFDADILLHTVPTSPAISLPERDFEAIVPAAGNSAILVPVNSRVSSGESGLLLELRDRVDGRTFASGVQRLTLRTSVETTIMWVLGSAAALLLGFGVWRSYRRRHEKPSLPAQQAD